MPAVPGNSGEFERAGRASLRRAAARHGGVGFWAHEFGVAAPRPRLSGPYKWSDERLRTELEAFVASRPDWPSQHEFIAAGKRPLWMAAWRSPRGIEGWARELGVTRRRAQSY